MKYVFIIFVIILSGIDRGWQNIEGIYVFYELDKSVLSIFTIASSVILFMKNIDDWGKKTIMNGELEEAKTEIQSTFTPLALIVVVYLIDNNLRLT